ncbi:MAG: ATP-binding cassette domain-containing protein [Alphaproteobacteria bacterium]|nr:ATP-binding cassette domain-containing protein [Alphaproteobacteria bacterium]
MSDLSHSPLLNLATVSKTFSSGTVALSPTSLTLGDGEFVSLVGPSGCGKSTLLRIVAGLTPPSTGEVTSASGADGLRTGFVFQEPTLMPWATVSENVALPLQLKNSLTSQESDRISTVLEWVGLKDFRDAYPRELSGGMRMRASIARAIVQQPDLLLLDEPFVALDEFTRAQLNEDLLRLWEDQKWTAIFVTHSIREAVFLSNRVLVMSPRPGQVIADLQVPFEYPRQPELRNDHAYADFCASISQQLASSIAGANS